MKRSVLPLALLPLSFSLSCKHLPENNSRSKSIQDFDGITLLPSTSYTIAYGQDVSIVLNTISQRPTSNAEMLINRLELTIEGESGKDKDACRTSLAKVSSRQKGETAPLEEQSRNEEKKTITYVTNSDEQPHAFTEVVLAFGSAEPLTCKVTIQGTGIWREEGDMGYKIVSDNPARDREIRAYGSTYEHRLRHYLWHTSRGMWTRLEKRMQTLKEKVEAAKKEGKEAEKDDVETIKDLEDTVAQYKKIGWEPPRYFRSTAPETVKTGAGEDFLYMHHKMLSRLKAYLKTKNLEMCEPWSEIPGPEDGNFPVAGPERKELDGNKSDEFYNVEIKTWEKIYQQESVNEAELVNDVKAYYEKNNHGQADNEARAKAAVQRLLAPREDFKYQGVKGISLSEYGYRLEATIHNSMHMRWAYEGASRPSAADPLDREGWAKGWAESFDNPSYDWLGDTYSSHVHPWFYRLHGWVDARLQTWLSINGYKSIGLKDECPKLEQPCYAWLSDARYADKGDGIPWEGPVVKEEGGSSAMSLHAHAAPVPNLSKRALEKTRGLRSEFEMMDQILLHPKRKVELEKKTK